MGHAYVWFLQGVAAVGREFDFRMQPCAEEWAVQWSAETCSLSRGAQRKQLGEPLQLDGLPDLQIV